MINEFYPSKLVDDLYDFIDDYLVGTSTYDANILDILINWFNKNHPNTELKTAQYGNAVVISFIDEHKHLQMEQFNI